jgi:Calx-beta domain-containing protein
MSRFTLSAARAPLAALLLVGSAAMAAPASADNGFLALSGGSVTEGDSGTTTLNFTLQLSSTQSTPVTAHFSTIATHSPLAAGDAVPGSACGSGADFIAVDGTVTIPANTSQILIPVQVCGDTLIEGTESFTGLVDNVVGSFCLELCAAFGTINDNDTAQPLPIVAPPSLSIGNTSVLEGDPSLFQLTPQARLNFPVSLSAVSASTVTVSFQTAAKGVSNDATAGRSCLFGVDYIFASGTLTFNPGETHKTISVQVCADNLAEPNEVLLVKLSTPVNATLADGVGIGVIVNDD